MKVKGFHHVAVQVKALEDVASFYREVLALPELERHHGPDGRLRSVWLDVGGGGFLALERVLALRIDRADRARIRAELERRGLPLVHETKWTLYVRDPEGNRVALSHHPED